MTTTSAQARYGMQRVNLDTVIVLQSLKDDLKPHEKRVLENSQWAVADIVYWEIAKLVQGGKVMVDLASPSLLAFYSRVQTLPITPVVARISTELDFDSDPADELIAATSIVYGVPLLTRDSKILASKMVPLAEFETED